VPDIFADDTPLNYKMMEHSGDFEVAKNEPKPKPSGDEIEANKQKWGWGT
jgi:hypothetical protein